MSTTAAGVAKSSDVPFLNIVDPEFDFNAPEVVEAQARSWYAETPIGLIVLRYAEARALLRDPRIFSDGERYMAMNGIADGPIYDWFVPMIANQSGEDHRRLRGLVNKAFTPRMISNLRPFIRAKAQELTEHLAAVEECDFVEDFGNPLPLAVMCELLGVPTEDYDTFRVWTSDVGLVFGLAHGGDIPARVETAVVGLNEYVGALMAEKKARPGDDLISALVAAQQEDGVVSAEELQNLLVTLVFAAHDTTRHQLANAMLAFAEHPEQWSLLGNRPELTDQAVEEVIRWFPSSTTIFRFAGEDFDYEGTHIAKGTLVLVCSTAAQRDPRVFHEGAKFDITVTREPMPPIQFGGGPHHCLGSALARAEVGESLPVLTQRLGPPVITGPFTWRPPLGIHGPDTLPLCFGQR